PVVADSTAESEYIAASEAAKEAVWIRSFVSQLGIVQSSADPALLFCDNTAAVTLAKEPRSHQRTKHILRKFHLLRDLHQRGEVAVIRVATEDNVADPLTKALSQQKHEYHVRAGGLTSSWL
ncbi:Ty1/Copia family ribonuclease HI, partial [Aciditerrimonas ferrireducens]